MIHRKSERIPRAMVDPTKDKDSGINKLIKVLSQDRRFLSEALSTVVQLKWKPKLSTAIEFTTMHANCRMMSMLYPIFFITFAYVLKLIT